MDDLWRGGGWGPDTTVRVIVPFFLLEYPGSKSKSKVAAYKPTPREHCARLLTFIFFPASLPCGYSGGLKSLEHTLDTLESHVAAGPSELQSSPLTIQNIGTQFLLRARAHS